jgi:flagellar hook-associated protein 3 FlgL
MDRVSTSGLYGSVLANLTTAQNAQVSASTQVSSGKKATDLKGFGAGAETLTAMQSVQSQVTSYLDQSNLIANKLSVQDSAMTQLGTSAKSARQAILDALASGDGTSLMQTLQGNLQDAVSALNTTYNGEYIFAGGQVNTKPVTATTLSDLTAPATVAGVFTNGQHAATNQINNNTTLQTGFLADQLGGPLFSAIKSIQDYSQSIGSFTGPLSEAQKTFLQGQLAVVQSANAGITSATAENGLTQKQVDSNVTALTDQQTSLAGLIGNISDADLAQASTNLATAQQAIQASAQVFQTLKNSSLVNLLPI